MAVAGRGVDQRPSAIAGGDLEAVVVQQAALKDRFQRRQVRQVKELEVEGAVAFADVVLVAGPCRRLHVPDQFTQARQVGVGQPFYRPLHASYLDAQAELQHLFRFDRAGRRHQGATVA